MQDHGHPGSPAQPIEAATSRVRVNAIANYLGRGWATLIGLICLPLFLKVLGPEAYGLIGAFAVIQAWALLLELGLTPTLNREIVRTRANTRSWQSLSDLIHTIEIIVVLTGVVLTFAVYVSAPFLATQWLSPHQLSLVTVERAISIMGALAGCRWVEQLYRAAVQGSEDQVWLNAIQSITETCRWVGALLAISLVDASVMTFFAWNLIVSILSLLILRRRVMAMLFRHTTARPQRRFSELLSVRGFAGGMFLSSLMSFLLTQTDKMVVGKLMPLREFGIYALVGTAAAGLLQLVQPMNVAVLPRFTTLVEAGRRTELAATFHNSSQWLSAIILPLGVTLVAFPERSLLAWTGQVEVSEAGAPIFSLLMLASILNALLNLPYMLQLAHGWTSLTNKVNAVAIIALLPILIWATKSYSGVGAAASIACLNLVSLLMMSTLVLRRLLPEELLGWFAFAVFLPALAGGSVGLVLRFVLPDAQDRLSAIVQLAVVGVAVGLAVFACLPRPRRKLRALIGSCL